MKRIFALVLVIVVVVFILFAKQDSNSQSKALLQRRYLVQTTDSPRLLEADLNSRTLENFNLVAFDSTMQRNGSILYTVIWETKSKQKEVFQIK